MINGKIRRSQAITTYGPGAIIDLREGSFMAAGIDNWPAKGGEIHEPELQASLKVKYFRMPVVNSANSENEFPVVRFPSWVVCPRCRRLAKASLFTEMFKQKERLWCKTCSMIPYPARLVIACAKGHIDDFPWHWWVHQDQTKECDRAILRLSSSSKTASISGVYVSCDKCGQKRSLGEAFSKNAFRFNCSGNRPWLGDREEGCTAQLRTMQRGASNLYYAAVISGLSIPPWSSDIMEALDEHWRTLEILPEELWPQTIIGLELPERLGQPLHLILDAARLLKRKSDSDEGLAAATPEELREQEYRAIKAGTTAESASKNFEVTAVEVSDGFEEVIGAVRRVDRLREVRVLQGFTRIDPPQNSSFYPQNLAAITKQSNKNWLPAIEVRGEGIFLELHVDRMADWEKTPSIVERVKKLNDQYSKFQQTFNHSSENIRIITPRFVLTHTFSHLLIRQFSLVCGYSSSALRERLFVAESSNENPGHAAIMIYTATPDSEGSLGGLVRQCQPDRLGALMIGALEEAKWCSSDPLCIESSGQGAQALNLAACHACALLPETCCDEFNRFLDRATIVGTLENPETGFFSQVIERFSTISETVVVN